MLEDLEKRSLGMDSNLQLSSQQSGLDTRKDLSDRLRSADLGSEIPEQSDHEGISMDLDGFEKGQDGKGGADDQEEEYELEYDEVLEMEKVAVKIIENRRYKVLHDFMYILKEQINMYGSMLKCIVSPRQFFTDVPYHCILV